MQQYSSNNWARHHIASKAFLIPTKNESITIASLSIQLELAWRRERMFYLYPKPSPWGATNTEDTLKVTLSLTEEELMKD